MFNVQRTDEFDAWLHALKDLEGKAAILVRLDRLAQGNAGDAGPVGEGVSELRIHVGPGYRAYYVRVGQLVYLMLAGGDKSAQARDIARAQEMARELRAEAAAARAKTKAKSPRKPK